MNAFTSTGHQAPVRQPVPSELRGTRAGLFHLLKASAAPATAADPAPKADPAPVSLPPLVLDQGAARFLQTTNVSLQFGIGPNPDQTSGQKQSPAPEARSYESFFDSDAFVFTRAQDAPGT